MPIGIETRARRCNIGTQHRHNEGRMPIGIETRHQQKQERGVIVTMRGECR